MVTTNSSRELDRMRYTVANCALGRVLIAASERGVCCVRLGDSGRRLISDLKREFPSAGLREDAPALADLAQRVVAAIDGGAADAEIPLDVRGTAFQLRVWDALRRIPRGETRTYSQLAAAIRQPRAVRAVAGACAANPVAVLIPCHRALRSDGGLGGYRWGLERKQSLLASEGSRLL